jgi:plastocyanin
MYKGAPVCTPTYPATSEEKGVRVSRPRFLAHLVLALLWGGLAPASAHSASAFANQDVSIVDFDYRPGSVTINAGDTVTWSQDGEQPHTVTADDGSFDSGQMAPGETFSMRFDSPGTYRYYCTLHGGPGGEGMSAVVTVEGGSGSEEPPSVDNGNEGEGGNEGKGGDRGGSDEDPAGQGKSAPTSNKSLPRTGGGPPAAWVFALALVLTGYVLARVARLSERVARR